MKQAILITFSLLFAVVFTYAWETANYVFVMFYGNDSEQLLTTIQVDESLKAHIEKRNIKFEWSETPIPRNFLILEGKGITAECDLTEYNDTWCVTDAEQRIIGISEIFPVGREISWFRVSEYDGDFAVEASGNDMEVGIYTNIDDQYPKENITLKKGKRFIFNFEGKIGKIGPESVQYIVKRK